MIGSLMDSPLGPQMALSAELSQDVEVFILGMQQQTPGCGSLLDAGILAEDVVDELLARLVAVGATGALGEVIRVAAPSSLPVRSVLAVGLGEGDVPTERLRQAAGLASRTLVGVGSAASALSMIDLAAAAEGHFLGAYAFNHYRTTLCEDAAKQPIARVELLIPETPDDEASSVLARSLAIAGAVATARNLVNTPPNHLDPAGLAAEAQVLGIGAGLSVEVLDEKALERDGFGGIIGVGKGSSRPPRLVRMAYNCGVPHAKKVALVGKGVTFDSGGISIKPATNMDAMTADMAGAAAVIASVALAAKLELRLDVTATIPMAENMPSATAQRPGDVLTQYGGTTVVVLNTDAEGRLILADAIVRACEDGPDYMIDVATLTGAQSIALGRRTPGVMGSVEFRDRVARISQAVGENAWPMPFPTELRADLNSTIADLANVTNHSSGGMLSAGLFLQEFVADGIQWAHLDVAGPAYNTEEPWGYTSRGATGVPVRTIIAVLESLADEHSPAVDSVI